MRIALFAALALLFAPFAAQAQLSNANVVSACGSPNTTYPVNGTRAITQDTAGKLCDSGSGGGGGGAVFGPTANGSPAANPPVVVGGTADGTGTGNVTNWKIDGSGNGFVTTTNAFALDATVAAGNASLVQIAASIGSPIPAGTNTIGNVVVTPSTTGGDTPYGLQATASTNSTLVSTGAHTLRAMTLINTTTTIYYLRMYDSASAPTCSSATGYSRTWPIPPAGSSGQAGGVGPSLSVTGVGFSSGLSFCVTGGPSSTDNTNAAVGVFINLDYK